MSSDVWVTLITAVIAPVCLRIAAHYWPSVSMPVEPPVEPAGPPKQGVYDIEEES